MRDAYTQEQKIMRVLEDAFPDWVYSFDLEKVETPLGWLGTRGSRTARSMAETKLIEMKHDPDDPHHYAMYRALRPARKVRYEVEGMPEKSFTVRA